MIIVFDGNEPLESGGGKVLKTNYKTLMSEQTYYVWYISLGILINYHKEIRSKNNNLNYF